MNCDECKYYRMNCDECKYYHWYYDWCEKWKCEVDSRAVHDCFEKRT